MAAHALVFSVDVRLPACHSLKDKRATLRPVLDGSRRRYGVAAAETGHHDVWQRAELAFSAVSSSATHTAEVIDNVERFLWSFPEIEVLLSDRTWAEPT